MAKRIHLPSVTGQILAGMVIGHAGFGIFDESGVQSLSPLTDFAIGLMAVSVGAHLNVRRLRNARKRLLTLLVLESLLIPGLVFGVAMLFPGMNWSFALLFGTIAISTAPATIVAVVKETRSKGVFVKTLIAAVALNNLSCMFFFELARAAAHVQTGAAGIGDMLEAPFVQLICSAAIGCGAALSMTLIHRLFSKPELIATGGLATLTLTIGLATHFDVSPLLSCLFLGFTQANVNRDRNRIVDSIFSNWEPAILATFFTLAGMDLTLEHAKSGGVLALGFVLARAGAKYLAAGWAMRIAGATEKVRKNLGLALVPQAGIAVGLVILLDKDPTLQSSAGELVSLFHAVVLSAVVLNEVVGPILTRVALARSGEMGNDRTRLIDFLQEENIVTTLPSGSKEEVIEALVDVLIASHDLPSDVRQPLLESVLAREADVSTCLGAGLAVPHGILPEGYEMVGVMGLSREGLPFDSPDGKPVHCIVVLGTPDTERDRHLQVLAALARSVGNPQMSARLFASESPGHAYEILHDEEAEDFNYFLDEQLT